MVAWLSHLRSQLADVQVAFAKRFFGRREFFNKNLAICVQSRNLLFLQPCSMMFSMNKKRVCVEVLTCIDPLMVTFVISA